MIKRHKKKKKKISPRQRQLRSPKCASAALAEELRVVNHKDALVRAACIVASQKEEK